MTRINKSKDGIIGSTPGIVLPEPTASTPETSTQTAGAFTLRKPLKRMNKAELLDTCLSWQIFDVEGKTKAQLIAELEK